MLKLKRKNIWIYALVILAIYFAYLFYKTTVDYNALLKEEKIYSEKIERENQRRDQLLKQDKDAESQETIEALARNNLNYLKENEILFIDGEKTE